MRQNMMWHSICINTTLSELHRTIWSLTIDIFMNDHNNRHSCVYTIVCVTRNLLDLEPFICTSSSSIAWEICITQNLYCDYAIRGVYALICATRLKSQLGEKLVSINRLLICIRIQRCASSNKPIQIRAAIWKLHFFKLKDLEQLHWGQFSLFDRPQRCSPIYVSTENVILTSSVNLYTG